MWRLQQVTTSLTSIITRSTVAMAMVIACSGFAAAQAPVTDTAATTAATVPASAKVAFDFPDLPPATVEIDLGQGLIEHALGLSDAAIAGFLEGLMTSHEAESAANAEFVAQQLTSARELGDRVSDVIHEVHIRVWDNLADEDQVAEKIATHLESQLGQGWESAVRVRDGNAMVRVLVHREGQSLSGLLIVVAEGNDVVVSNVIGDLSPEKVQRLTATATKIGVMLGLDKQLNQAVEQLKHQVNAVH